MYSTIVSLQVTRERYYHTLWQVIYVTSYVVIPVQQRRAACHAGRLSPGLEPIQERVVRSVPLHR